MYQFPHRRHSGILPQAHPRSGGRRRQSWGPSGLQVYATATKLAKTEMTPAQRKDFLRMVKDHGHLLLRPVRRSGQGLRQSRS